MNRIEETLYVSRVLEKAQVPNWVVGTRLYLSISYKKRLDIPFSTSLLMHSMREIGQKFFAWE